LRRLIFSFIFLFDEILNSAAMQRKGRVWNRKIHCIVTGFLFFCFPFAALRCIRVWRMKMFEGLKKGGKKELVAFQIAFHSSYIYIYIDGRRRKRSERLSRWIERPFSTVVGHHSQHPREISVHITVKYTLISNVPLNT